MIDSGPQSIGNTVALGTFDNDDTDDDNDDDRPLLLQTTSPNMNINIINTKHNRICNDYETLLSTISTGKYHYFVLAKCALCNASNAIEMISISYIINDIKSDLKMSNNNVGLLSGSIFFGMMLGGWIWASMADNKKYGRIKILQQTLMVNGIFGLLSSFANNFVTLLIFRFISGIGIGGSIPVSFSYACEFFDKSKRGKYISILSLTWPIASIIVTLIGWIVIPNKNYINSIINVLFYIDIISSWRIFLIICSIPAIFTSIIFGYFSDNSPNFLIYTRNDLNQASIVLKKMAKENKRYHIINQMFNQENIFDAKNLQQLTMITQVTFDFLVFSRV